MWKIAALLTRICRHHRNLMLIAVELKWISNQDIRLQRADAGIRPMPAVVLRDLNVGNRDITCAA